MRLRDLTISGKLTVVTTGSVILVFLAVCGVLLWAWNALYQDTTQAIAELAYDESTEARTLLEQKTVRSLENTGLLAALAVAPLGRSSDRAELDKVAATIVADPEFDYVDFRDSKGNSLLARPSREDGSFRVFDVAGGGSVVIGLADGFEPALAAYYKRKFDALGASLALQREVAIALVIALVSIAALVTALVIYYTISRLSRQFIIQPTDKIKDALSSMEEQRDYSARIEPDADDELGSTVVAFNRGLGFLERQNDDLNESVIQLLQISDAISRTRDLSLKMPVKADVTGPLSDALNRITAESSRVLARVREISRRVGRASERVQTQAKRVVEVSDNEREIIEQAASDLAEAVKAIDTVAELAQFCNDAATKATASTDQALTSVREAMDGMGSIRTGIQETGRRIKRLGERSQEISGIVDIINSFAERTHVLAINASMQAVTAGEAGRGFAVVAQEVQRLADSSRNATSQIATLINNIQVETSDTIQTVNQATEAVGRESRTVENAGLQMQDTQQANATLADAVRQIYARSQAQVEANRTLMSRVEIMRSSTVETTDQLDQQTQETNRLVSYADELIEAIQLFKLPEPSDMPPAADARVGGERVAEMA